MLLKREDKENRQVELTLRVEKSDWDAALAAAYEEVKSLYPVEGEITREKLEAQYGSDFLYQEAVNATFPAALVEAVCTEELRLAGAPELQVVTIGPDGYTFTALIDLYPQVKLGQYKGLRAVWAAAELSEDDSAAAIARYLHDHPMEEHPEKAAMGDEVTMDFEGFVDGVPFDGGKAENYPLVLGSGMFIPGFEEQVAGIGLEEERLVKVTFPKPYTPELEGKDAIFQVKARKIVRRRLPELDDDYAKAQGFDDAAALRRRIMADALEQKQEQARADFEDALIGQVIDGMEVTVPDAMIESQLTGIIEALRQQLQSQGAELEQYLEAGGMTMDGLRAQTRAQAEKAAYYELAMTAVADAEGITVTEEDLNRHYTQMSAMYGMTPQQLRAQLPAAQLSHDIKLSRARAAIINSGIRA